MLIFDICCISIQAYNSIVSFCIKFTEYFSMQILHPQNSSLLCIFLLTLEHNLDKGTIQLIKHQPKVWIILSFIVGIHIRLELELTENMPKIVVEELISIGIIRRIPSHCIAGKFLWDLDDLVVRDNHFLIIIFLLLFLIFSRLFLEL